MVQRTQLLGGSRGVFSGLAPHVKAILAFTVIYMLAGTVYALGRGNQEFVLYVGVMFVLIFVIGLVHRDVGLGGGILAAMSLWGLAHLVGGLVPAPEGWPTSKPDGVIYTLWIIPEYLKYDHIVHAFGFGTTTWICWRGMESIAGRLLDPTFGRLVLAAAAGSGFGALNEVIEFFATLALPETGVGGYINTGWDLVANLVGCSIAALMIRWTNRVS